MYSSTRNGHPRGVLRDVMRVLPHRGNKQVVMRINGSTGAVLESWAWESRIVYRCGERQSLRVAVDLSQHAKRWRR